MEAHELYVKLHVDLEMFACKKTAIILDQISQMLHTNMYFE